MNSLWTNPYFIKVTIILMLSSRFLRRYEMCLSLYLLAGIEKLTSVVIFLYFKKSVSTLTYDPVIIALCIYLGEMKIYVYIET